MTVAILSHQANDFVLSITVQDTGVGIPEEEVNKIQLRFNKLTSFFGALSLKHACIRLEETLVAGKTADRNKHYARVIHEMERLAEVWIKIKN